jgi:hypothetical protein
MRDRRHLLFPLVIFLFVLVLTSCEAFDPDETHVQGRVWVDRNKNGIQEEDEIGLPGVTVRAINDDPDDPRSTVTQTDSKGDYSMDILRFKSVQGWKIVFEAGDRQFTLQNIGSDAKDSDVDANGESPLGDWFDVDAGVLPLEAADAPEPNEPTVTPSEEEPVPSPVPSATVTESLEVGQGPGESSNLTAVNCQTGVETDPGQFAGSKFEITAENQALVLLITLLNPVAGGDVFWGLDWAGSGNNTIKADPNVALSGNAVGGASTGIVAGELAGITAAQAGPDNEPLIVSVSGAAEVIPSDSGDQLRLEIFGGDIPRGITELRPILSDGETCIIMGDLSVKNGFLPAADFGSGVPDFLASRTGTRFSEPVSNTCVMLPGDLVWEPSGPQTFNITVNGKNLAVQFSASSGTADDRLVDVTQANWTVVGESTHETPLLIWRLVQLHAGDKPYSLMAVSDNGGGEPPVSFVILISGSDPLTEADLEALHAVIRNLASGFRSGLELTN